MDVSGPKEGSEFAANLRHNVRLDRVEYLPIDLLTGYKRQLRKRSDASRAALKNSVSGFGIVLPILIDRDNVIIGGAGIVEAAKSLGHVEVPTIKVEHLDDDEVRMLRIALNKLGETAEWDKIELSAEFSELLSLDTTLAYEITGFETIEIDSLLHPPANADPSAEDPDEEPCPVGDPESAVSRLGDHWLLGDHRVVCGSSLNEEVVERLLGDEQARMVLTDHPFNVKISGHVSGLGKHKHREFAQASGEMTEAEFIAFLTRSIEVLSDRCVEGGLLYMYIDWRHIWRCFRPFEPSASPSSTWRFG